MSILKTNGIQGVSASSNAATLSTTGISLDRCTGMNGVGLARNLLHNPDFQIAERGATINPVADDAYCADRWYGLSEAANSIAYTRSSTSPPTGVGYFGEFKVASTDNTKVGIAQVLENDDCVSLQGQSVTLSFQAKVSSATAVTTMKAAIVSWAGTADQVTSDLAANWNNSGTNPTLAANWTYENTPADLNVTTSWAKYSVTATIDTSNTTNVAVFIWNDSLEVDQNDWFGLTNVQLERGSTASTFNRRSIVEERLLCKRFYHDLHFGDKSTTRSALFYSGSTAYTRRSLIFDFPVEMRAVPTAEVVLDSGSLYANRTFYTKQGAVLETDPANTTTVRSVEKFILSADL
tara:strand:+ start:8381 stop:9430 length:1050 start_codon:yes stop_codon:yes gene_type:complete